MVMAMWKPTSAGSNDPVEIREMVIYGVKDHAKTI
jgi:hypothetical protein